MKKIYKADCYFCKIPTKKLFIDDDRLVCNFCLKTYIDGLRKIIMECHAMIKEMGGTKKYVPPPNSPISKVWK